MGKRPPLTDLEILEQSDASLLDLVDHVLNQGIVISGEVMLGVAGVDLVYLRLAAVLCSADRLLAPKEDRDAERTGQVSHPRAGVTGERAGARRQP